MISVKVALIGSAIKEILLEDGATVQDALTGTNTTIPDGFDVKVDGNDATTTTMLNNDARVVIAKGAKGNS